MKALLRVHQKNWTRSGRLDLMVVNMCTFVSYFEDATEMDVMLKKALQSFNNSLHVLQRLGPNMSPSNLVFDSTPIWIQILDFSMD